MVYSVRSVSGSLYPRTHVFIYNDIEAGTRLTVLCKSKDDDLGTHVLAYRQHYEFSFHRNIFQKTLFFCGMQWNGTVYRFDVYDGERDEHCDYHCEWNVHREGACLINQDTTKFDICYRWNP
ncbi:hypothetical protein V6N13_082792 [Hibiscus sabdariffa]|uniref:S-protein homolog n=1 Tax=Hibiscus sabdariffa TaxID=183260 RepID=A0ABR2BZY5_9ROSI